MYAGIVTVITNSRKKRTGEGRVCTWKVLVLRRTGDRCRHQRSWDQRSAPTTTGSFSSTSCSPRDLGKRETIIENSVCDRPLSNPARLHVRTRRTCEFNDNRYVQEFTFPKLRRFSEDDSECRFPGFISARSPVPDQCLYSRKVTIRSAF